MTTRDWHTSALHDLEHSTMSLEEIAKKYGRTQMTVYKLLRQHQIVRRFPPKRRGPKRLENGTPLSHLHHAIGIRLTMARGAEGVRAYASKIGVAPVVLTQMEVGQYDFKFSQLLTIAKVTGKPLSELMQSFESNLYKQSGRMNVGH
jgi:hypothetical protein